MKTSVALIGFMGTGKTAVGKELSEKLSKRFIETDVLVERKAGKSIADIFRQNGEIAFREMEIGIVKAVAGTKNVVIACGGGVVLNRINIDRLREECIIIHLTASAGVILKRTANDARRRPLLSVSDRLQQIRNLSRFRQPYYRNAADIIVNTSRLGIKTVVQRIEEELSDNEDFC